MKKIKDKKKKQDKKINKKSKKKSKFLFLIIVILILVLLVLLFFEFKILEELKKKEVQHIEIIDGCSLLMGTILHQIRDEADCENACISECYIVKKEFYDSNFTENSESCNGCDCYCK